jgi:hypothetical protein
LPEGCRPSREGLGDQLGVVVHSCLTVRDAGGNQEVPAAFIIAAGRAVVKPPTFGNKSETRISKSETNPN